MKKIYILIIYLSFLAFLVFTIFMTKVDAKTGVLSPEQFWINSQTTDPFHITVSGNSSTTAYFHYSETFSSNPFGPYYFFSVVSNKKIDIKRTNSAGSSCTNSCFSNDVYLLMTDNTAGSYGYLFYFNARKYQDNIGSTSVTWQIDDNFRFYNKESGTADIYIYGVYANDINEIPNYINDANTTTKLLEEEQNSTNTIVDNNDNNTNTIIQNDNANTDKIIESNKVCTQIDKKNIKDDNKSLSGSGNVSDRSTTGITDYINIYNANVKVLDSNNTTYYATCFYNINKVLINCISNDTLISGELLTLPQNTYYMRTTITKNTNKPMFEICKNGNQATNDSINDLNDNITNSGIDSPNSDFSDMEDMIAENGVITNLLSLPITLYSKILNSVNGTCSNYNLGTLFGTSITFSCISLQTLLGNTIWGVIDILFSGFTIYAIAKKMIKVFNNMSSLKEGDVIDD